VSAIQYRKEKRNLSRTAPLGVIIDAASDDVLDSDKIVVHGTTAKLHA